METKNFLWVLLSAGYERMHFHQLHVSKYNSGYSELKRENQYYFPQHVLPVMFGHYLLPWRITPHLSRFSVIKVIGKRALI